MHPVYVCLFSVEKHAPVLEELTEEERARAARFLREEDRQRCLLGRWAIRRLCAEEMCVEPRAVELGATVKGKPFLVSTGATLQFNLAHSGDCVALAWGRGGPVGVDVEMIEGGRERPFLEIAGTAFSPQEQEVLERISSRAAAWKAGLAETFFRIWARKEAIVKAEGCGIAGGLQSFSVARWAGAGAQWPELVEHPGAGRTWRVEEFAGRRGYAAAVAMAPEGKLCPTEPEEAAWARH